MSVSEQNTDKSSGGIRERVLKEHGYCMTEEIGQGVSGTAFVVKNTEGDLYVVKEIKCKDKKSFLMIEQEINLLKKLHFGYVVSYEDSFHDKEAGFFYIVMEYCAGGDLLKSMQLKQKKNGIFDEEQILDWLVQICLALQHLHEKNVLHRDIKPQNIFLTEDGYINVGDFGYSKVLNRADAYAHSVVGAELYASPEIYDGKHNSKSDIWSFGWLLHDLCMLDVWSNTKKRHCAHSTSLMGNVPEISDKYSEDLQKLISQMLSCNPKDRPSATEILAKPFLEDAVKRNKRLPDTLEARFMKSVKTFDEACFKHYKDFEAVVKEWGETTDALENVHYNTTAGSLAGSVIGATGGITALVGLALAPFTLGASLIVSGVGIGVGVAGGVTGAASSITNTVQQKTLRESLKKIKQNYQNVSEPIFDSLNSMRSILKSIQKFSDFINASTNNVVQRSCDIDQRNILYGKELTNLGMLANIGRIAAQSARVGRVAAEVVAGVFSGLLVILDSFFIVKDSQEIHQMRQNWKTDDPEKVSSDVLKSIAQIRKTHQELCNVLEEIEKTREELKEIIKVAKDDKNSVSLKK